MRLVLAREHIPIAWIATDANGNESDIFMQIIRVNE